MQFNPKSNPTKKAGKNNDNRATDFTFDPKKTREDLRRERREEPAKTAAPGQGLIKSWSASTLKKFETCRWQMYLARVVKLYQEKVEAMERGTAIHDEAEHFVDGTQPEFSTSLTKSPKFREFMPSFERLKEKYADGLVEVEGEWGFDKDWGVTGWMAPDTWARIKMDVLEWHEEPFGSHAKIIDHKTGNKWGNEISHADQGIIYSVATFMKFPQLQLLDVEMWYLDQGEISHPQRYTRNQAMTFLPRVTNRANIMTSALQHDFKPSPSKPNCKFCPFNREEDGCDYRHIS